MCPELTYNANIDVARMRSEGQSHEPLSYAVASGGRGAYRRAARGLTWAARDLCLLNNEENQGK